MKVLEHILGAEKICRRTESGILVGGGGLSFYAPKHEEKIRPVRVHAASAWRRGVIFPLDLSRKAFFTVSEIGWNTRSSR